MDKEITIDASKWEFGNSVSCGLLFPYNLKLHGFKTHVCSRILFPKEWTDIWYDEFGTKSTTHNGTTISLERVNGRSSKSVLENLVFGSEAMRTFLPIPLPKIERKINDKYIVLIPTTEEKALKNLHKLELCLTFEGWMRVADFIRSQGMKVVSFSCGESCTKEQADKIGDISFYANGKDLKPNSFLKNQLEWMSNAETSVSLGGAFHVAYSFNVPGIGYDGQMVKNYSHITRSYSSCRNDIFILKSQHNLSLELGVFDYKNNPKKSNPFYLTYSNLIIEKIKEVLVSK